MSNISKVQRNVGLTKADDDVIECVRVNGQLVDLRTVSPVLRAQYHAVSKRVARHEAAKAELNAIGQQILGEQAIKRAVTQCVSGDHAVANRLMKGANALIGRDN
jgi:hypothetical protein